MSEKTKIDAKGYWAATIRLILVCATRRDLCLCRSDLLLLLGHGAA